MKFIAKKIHWIGILLLVGFAAAAAGLYFDVPARVKKPAAVAAKNYACPMHREVVSAKAGDCPKCGMALKLASTITAADASHSGCGSPEGAEQHGCCSSRLQNTQAVLPPGHPPVEGYTVQSGEHAGCNHPTEPGITQASRQ